MAKGTILLPIGAATLGDGTAGNAAPELRHTSGTEASPRKSMLTLSFGPSASEHAWWTFQLPVSYWKDPVVKLLWMTPAVAAASCVWGARLGAVSPGDEETPLERSAGTPVAVGTAANEDETYRLTATTVELAQSEAVAGDFAFLHVFRDAAAANDTLTADAVLLSVALEYTTA